MSFGMEKNPQRRFQRCGCRAILEKRWSDAFHPTAQTSTPELHLGAAGAIADHPPHCPVKVK